MLRNYIFLFEIVSFIIVDIVVSINVLIKKCYVNCFVVYFLFGGWEVCDFLKYIIFIFSKNVNFGV